MNNKLIPCYFFLTFFLLLGSSTTFAKLKKHEIGRPRYEMFPLIEACKFSGLKHMLLAEKKDTLTIDCMGTDLSVMNFCQKKYPAATDLLRGYIEKTNKYVICERGQTVHVSVICDKRDQHFCKKEKWGCQKIGKAYARDLRVSHSSILTNSGVQNINCYFTGELKTSQDDLKNL